MTAPASSLRAPEALPWSKVKSILLGGEAYLVCTKLDSWKHV